MTNAEMAILALIAEAPRHGYEVEQVIDARGMREWTNVGFSSIYYLLTKLEQRDWVQSHKGEAIGQGPPRKVYSMTGKGEQALKSAVVEALSKPERDPAHFQLGLANISLLPHEEAIEALQTHAEALQSRAGELRNRQKVRESLPVNVVGMFELSLQMINTQQKWIQTFIRTWEQHNVQD